MRKVFLCIFAFFLLTGIQYVVADDFPGVAFGSVLSLDGDDWLLATDAENVGREQGWFNDPREQAKAVAVPNVIQFDFPRYHGVVWYWKDFVASVNPHKGGRYLIKFELVDYKADVWVNGIFIGSHETADGSFVFDITDAVKSGRENRLAVRVLNPTNTAIDGMTLNETPHRNKRIPTTPGCDANHGGIQDSVFLMMVPAVYIADVYVVPDPKTGVIELESKVINTNRGSSKANLQFVVSTARFGQVAVAAQRQEKLASGENIISSQVKVENPRLWDVEDPFLYRLTARVAEENSQSFDEFSTRCGFRDFRYEDGWFRLNGRRIFLKCSHLGNCFPIGIHRPYTQDLMNRDLLNLKAMGFNAVRYIAGVGFRENIDYCDEIGLMVYEEPYAAWCLAYSDQFAYRFDLSHTNMIVRDRNHPSITMWGLLNETPDGPVFRHAVKTLKLVRSLDMNRLVFLSSGRWDNVKNEPLNLPEGLVGWKTADGLEPCVVYNGSGKRIEFSQVINEPGRFSFHPGPVGEYSAVRWTAPENDSFKVAAKFIDISEQRATTDVHVLHNGKVLFDGYLNVNGEARESLFSDSLKLQKGDTLTFVVGYGNSHYGADTTGLEIQISSPKGDVYDVAKDYSDTDNPNGSWEYGMLAPGETPDSGTFSLYTHSLREPAGTIGTLSNPGSLVWEDVLDDQHPYLRAPLSANEITLFRTYGSPEKHYFASECGVGSGNNWARLLRLYQQYGGAHTEAYDLMQGYLNGFMGDWDHWKMDEIFMDPDDFFNQTIARMASQRKINWNAIRGNPNMAGFNLTGVVDQGLPSASEGLTTAFRELKPGTMDVMFDCNAKLRLCLFAEPANIYRGSPIKLDVVLANEDDLKPGTYPVRLQVIGPDHLRVLDRTIDIEVPEAIDGKEPSLAYPVFSEHMVIDGPTGRYQFLARFAQGAGAAGGDNEFYVTDSADMPNVEAEVVLWGDDPGLEKWLGENGIRCRKFDPAVTDKRELILASTKPQAPGGAEAFAELATRIARGSSVVFLSPDIFAGPNGTTHWVPLKNKGSVGDTSRWLYHADDWAKNHPIFDGLQIGLLDYTIYRDIIPNQIWRGQQIPAEAVAGSHVTCLWYDGGLLNSVQELGAGRFILNTLWIRRNLGLLSENEQAVINSQTVVVERSLKQVPAAERLLRNMLNYAARDIKKPVAELPNDFTDQLKAMGY